MLPQQVVKVLLKVVQAVQSNKGLERYEPCDSNGLIPSIRAIIHSRGSESCGARKQDDLCELPRLLHIFRHRAARLLVTVAKQLNNSVSCGKTMQEAWNESLVQMARTSRAYCLFLVIRDAMEGVMKEQQSGDLGPAEAKVLADLTRLFALYWIEHDIGEFLEDGFMRAEEAEWVRSNVLKYLDIIRPNAVALVDARDYSDFRLKSALGRYDGDVYPYIMKAAMKDPLNAVDPGPAYDPELKRLIAGGVGVWNGTASRL